VDAGCVKDDGQNTNFVPYRDGDKSVSESDRKILMKCQEEL